MSISERSEALFLFPWHLLAFLARIGEADGDGLLAALHLASLSAFAAFRFASFVTVHLALTSWPDPFEYFLFRFRFLAMRTSLSIDYQSEHERRCFQRDAG